MARAAVLALGIALGACAQGSVAPPDMAPQMQKDAAIDSNGCSMQPCSILPQCGCNGNTTCDLDGVDLMGTACRSINSPGTETATCTQAVDCDRGYRCIGGASYASCKKYCTGDADCGAPRGKCFYQLTDMGQTIPDIPKLCSSNCQPEDTTAAGCPSTYKCTLFAFNDGTAISDCTPAGTMVQGADCTTTDGKAIESRCARGYQCVRFGNETAFKCRRTCTAPGTTTGCNGQQCIGYAAPGATLGGTTYGVCAP